MSRPSKISASPGAPRPASWDAARQALAVADAAFAEAFGATARARAARRLPASALTGTPWEDSSTAQIVVASMSSTERDALRWLDRCWPDAVPAARTRFVEHALLPLAVCGPAPACVVNPRALVALAAAMAPDADAAWATSFGADAAAARCVARAWAEATLRPTGVVPPPWSSTVVEALRRASACARDGSGVAALAGALRARAWEALTSEGAPSSWGTFLTDAPAAGDRVPLHDSNPLRLTVPDAELVSALISPADPAVPLPDLVAWIAEGYDAGYDAVRERLAETPWRTDSRPPLADLSPSPDAPRWSATELTRRIVEHAQAPSGATADLLVCAEADVPSWRFVAQLSSRNDLVTSVQALEQQGVDWGDFDAPGEGALPLTWRLALHLAGAWPADRAQRWERDGWVEPASAGDLDAALRALPSQTAASIAAGDPLGGGAAQAGRTVRDGIAEAYGDVHAPSDPFSIRRAAPGAGPRSDSSNEDAS